MNKKIISIAIAAIVVVAGIGLYLTEQNKTPPQNRDIFDLSFEDYTGTVVSLSDFAGRPLVINAWAAWCPFCRKELPDFAAAQQEFGDAVVIIAINRAEPREVAKKYSDELEITGTIILLLDPLDVFYQTINGFSMPETVFINKDGIIKIHKRGFMDITEIREKINTIL
jgi:thiol-disulfide isomerase/thioredoxin